MWEFVSQPERWVWELWDLIAGEGDCLTKHQYQLQHFLPNYFFITQQISCSIIIENTLLFKIAMFLKKKILFDFYFKICSSRIFFLIKKTKKFKSRIKEMIFSNSPMKCNIFISWFLKARNYIFIIICIVPARCVAAVYLAIKGLSQQFKLQTKYVTDKCIFHI